jgi:hypothetical protein
LFFPFYCIHHKQIAISKRKRPGFPGAAAGSNPLRQPDGSLAAQLDGPGESLRRACFKKGSLKISQIKKDMSGKKHGVPSYLIGGRKFCIVMEAGVVVLLQEQTVLVLSITNIFLLISRKCMTLKYVKLKNDPFM